MKRRLMKKTVNVIIALTTLMAYVLTGFLQKPGETHAAGTTDGLLAWYTFDPADVTESDPGTFTISDASNNGNDAVTAGSGVTFGSWEEQNIGTLRLPGGSADTGGHVKLPDGLLDNVEDVTVTTWVYMRSTTNYTRIFDFGTDTGKYMYLTPTGNNDGAKGLAFGITTSGWSNEQTVQKGTNLEVHTWTHVAVVLSGKTATIYQDGIKVGEKTQMSLNPKSLAATTNNMIGKGQFPDETINASFADFRIYNRALSVQELSGLLNKTDEDIVAADKEAINLGNLRTIENDLTLPATGIYGSQISWQSSRPDVIGSDGTVTRPAPGQPDAELVLTATLTKGNATATREFQATVLRVLSDQEKVDLDKDAISLGDVSAVIQDLKLPTEGSRYGSAISWKSSDPTVVAVDGKVTRPAAHSGNAEVSLTATVKNGSASGIRTFMVTVQEASFVLTLVSIREANIKTVPGVVPKLPETVTGEYNDKQTTRELPVVWAEVDPLKVAQPGVFTVEGSVSDSPLKAKAHVLVQGLMAQSQFENKRLEAGQPLIAGIKGKNAGSSPIKVTAALALYDSESKLRDVSYSSGEIAAYMELEMSAKLVLPDNVAGHTAKIFVWEGSDIGSSNLNPLSLAAELKSEVTPGEVPATPANLTAKPLESPEISVSWDESPEATGYDLEVDGRVVSGVTSPYVHNELVYGSTHTYAVRAKKGEKPGAWSRTVTAVATSTPSTNLAAAPFALGDVTLQPSLFTENRDREYAYLDSLDIDRLLYSFRATAGLDTRRATPLTGWDAPNDKLRGHSTGHYLSAVAQAYASSGEEKWKNKIDAIINELAIIQEQMPSAGNGMTGTKVGASKPELIGNNREGYLSAYPERQFILLENGGVYVSGSTDSNNIDSIWAPYYTLHKIMAGLLDCYELAGNEQALDILVKLGDWVNGRLSVLPQATLTEMWGKYIAGEYGGMNETLARLGEITGDTKYLDTAKLFDNPKLFEPTAINEDKLNGLHANQHIPQIIGALRIFDQTNDPYYYNVANNFWSMVVNKRQLSNGGTGQGEHFRAANTVASILGSNTAENCATYNMLKLTRDLFFHNPSAEYMDYYERGLFNGILSSQDQSPANNGVVYFMPLGPGLAKSYGRGGFTCCAGTGLESQTKYQDSIYFRSADNNSIYVNMYVPSTLDWADKGFRISQTADFPKEDSTTITVEGSGQLDMKLRVPYWAEKGFNVKINNVDQALAAVPGTYVTISRNWQSGDVVEVSIPYTLRYEPAPDDEKLGSLFYGPILLVAKNNQSTYLTLDVDRDNPESSIGKTDNPLHFTVDGVSFVPMFEAYNFKYHAYIKTKF
ncbi:glycoside hydrolase family 127 protein [Paenibacillus albidus]|uniref:beta-L-arabinofuranosidase domain-containing protein n=1 Tax=Paenibacillus albidus TaxID=2041023 RepID=UPI001BE71D41|nr:beta-L-arabinofuranosidase domain-containing protein [Paenibacillus albidus]MBT2291878.1 glycoside hydrolase family 127 protein [Paenibacillus albidus]